MKEQTQQQVATDDEGWESVPRDESSDATGATGATGAPGSTGSTTPQERETAMGDATASHSSSSTRIQPRHPRRRPRPRAGAAGAGEGPRGAAAWREPAPSPSLGPSPRLSDAPYNGPAPSPILSSSPSPVVPPWRATAPATATPIHNGQAINGDNRLQSDSTSDGEVEGGPRTNGGSGGVGSVGASWANNNTASSNANANTNANATSNGGNSNSNGVNGFRSSESFGAPRTPRRMRGLNGNGPNHNGSASSAAPVPSRQRDRTLPPSQSVASTEHSRANGSRRSYGHNSRATNGFSTSAGAGATATATDLTPPPNAPRGPRSWLLRQGANGNGTARYHHPSERPSPSSVGARAANGGSNPTMYAPQQSSPSSSSSPPNPLHQFAVQQPHTAAAPGSEQLGEVVYLFGTNTPYPGPFYNWHGPLSLRPRPDISTSTGEDPVVAPTSTFREDPDSSNGNRNRSNGNSRNSNNGNSNGNSNGNGNGNRSIVTHSVAPADSANTACPHPSRRWGNGGGSAEDNDGGYGDDGDDESPPWEWDVRNGRAVYNPRHCLEREQQEDDRGYFRGSDGDIPENYHLHSHWPTEPGQMRDPGASAAGPSLQWLQQQQQHHHQQQDLHYAQPNTSLSPFALPLAPHPMTTQPSTQVRFGDEPPNSPRFRHPHQPPPSSPPPSPHQQAHQGFHPHTYYHDPRIASPQEYRLSVPHQPSYPPPQQPPVTNQQPTPLARLVAESEPEPQMSHDPGFAENQANMARASDGLFGHVGREWSRRRYRLLEEFWYTLCVGADYPPHCRSSDGEGNGDDDDDR